MRLVKLENIEYKEWELIFRSIIEVIPFALLNQGYSKELKTGFFNFWDSDYIPNELKPFIMQPPLSRENLGLLTEKMKKAMLPYLKRLYIEDTKDE